MDLQVCVYVCRDYKVGVISSDHADVLFDRTALPPSFSP